MPRNLEFNEEEAKWAMVRAFRTHGYAGVTIKVLERETGLSSGSLYNSFGGKEEIFLMSLRHYNQNVVGKRVKDHLEGRPVRVGLRSLFLSVLEDQECLGCMLTNSAVEFGASQTFARPEIEAGLDILRRAFVTATTQIEQPTNILNHAQKQLFTAEKLLALYQGVLVLVRSGQSPDRLRDLINHEIDQLTGERP